MYNKIMESKIKTAVFGGAFDPIHSQHVEVAEKAVDALSVSRLVIVPTKNPPHKSDAVVSFKDRVNMLKAAFKIPGCEVIVDEIENNDRSNNCTADIVPELKARYGPFYYVIGGDSLEHFHTWVRPWEILREAPLAVFDREGYLPVKETAARILKKWQGDIVFLPFTGKAMSSSDLKACLLMGERPSDMPEAVTEYIVNHGLYSKYLSVTDKLSGLLTEARFIHSKNTVRAAVALNSRHNLQQDFDKVFLSALLHDAGKYRYVKEEVPADAIGTPVEHQFAGAVIARDLFGINDTEILNAVKYHTTGRENMSVIEKIVYAADMVSEERVYPGVDKLRAAVYNDFDRGFRLLLKESYLHVRSKSDVYPLTLQACLYYNVFED